VNLVHHYVVSIDIGDSLHPMIYGWAPGVGPLVLPDDVGFYANKSSTLMLQLHYNNINQLSGVVDNSGIRIYYTPILRKFDAGILQLGDFLALNNVPIPEGIGLYEIQYDCPSECLANVTQPLYAISSMLHMHERGALMWSDQWRNGSFVQELNRVDFFNFNLQQSTPVNFTIMPGDRLSVHCVYNLNPTSITQFGIASYQEMCINFIMYYPKIPIEACGYSLFGETYCGIQLPILNPTMKDPTEPHVIFGSQNTEYVKDICGDGNYTISSGQTNSQSGSNSNVVGTTKTSAKETATTSENISGANFVFVVFIMFVTAFL